MHLLGTNQPLDCENYLDLGDLSKSTCTESILSLINKNIFLELLNDLECMNKTLDGRVLSGDQLIKLFRILKDDDPQKSLQVIQFLIINNGWRVLEMPADNKKFLNNLITGFKEDFVKNLLLMKTRNDYNFLHSLSALGDIELLLDSLKRIAKELNSNGFLKKLILSQTKQNNNFLQVLFSNEVSNLNCFVKLAVWIRAEQSLGDNTLKPLFSDKNNDQNNLIHVITPSVESLKAVLVYIMEHLQHNEVKKWLQDKNVREENFLHILANVNPAAVPSIISLMHGLLNDHEFLGKILIATDKSGQTVLNNLYCNGTKSLIATLQLEEVKRCLEHDTILQMIIGDKDISETYQFYTVFVHVDKDLIKNAIKETAQSSNLLDFYLQKSENDRNKKIYSFLYYFCKMNENYAHQKTLEFMFSEMDIKLVEDLLSTTSSTGWTFLLMLSQQNNQTSFVEVIKFLLASKLDKQVMAKVLKGQTIDGWTFLHFLSQNNTHTSFGELLKILCQNFELSFVKELLRTETSQHLTFLSVMSCYNVGTSPAEVLQTLFNTFDKNFASQLLLTKSNKLGDAYINVDEGWTFLHHFCYHNKNCKFIEILKVLEKEMDINSFKNLLSFKNNEGSTFLHYLSHFNDATYFKELLDIIIGKLDESFVHELLQAVAYHADGTTFLHKYCQYNKNASFVDFLNILLEKFDKNHLMVLFSIKSYNTGGTFLHYLCEHNKPMPEFFRILMNAFDQSCIKKLFSSENYNNQTFLDILEHANKSVFNDVENDIKNILGK